MIVIVLISHFLVTFGVVCPVIINLKVGINQKKWCNKTWSKNYEFTQIVAMCFSKF